MIRLFVEEKLEPDLTLSLDDKKSHYLMHVMRCSDGDEILLFNGKDGEFRAKINQIAKKKYVCHMLEQTKKQQKTKPCILCPAIIKKENMDIVLQKATELGVSDIFPIITERTVVRHFNLERAKLIVAEASEQSERLDCPMVHEPVYLYDLFQKLPQDVTLFFLSERGQSDLKKQTVQTPAFLIGPEGGFTEKEVSYLLEQSCVSSIHLGTTILRAETASIAILSCWQYRDTFNI